MAAGLAVLASLATAGSAAQRPDAPFWAAQLDSMPSSSAVPRLRALRAGGTDALIVEPGQPGEAALLALAGRFKLPVIQPAAPPRSAAARRSLRAACAGKAGSVDRCAIRARSVDEARRWLARGSVDYVVLRVNSVQQFLELPANRSQRTRLLGVAPLEGGLNDTWRRAVAVADGDPGTGLAPRIGRKTSPSVLGGFFRLAATGGRQSSLRIEPELANIWVDTNGGSCARHGAPGEYADAQACGSFNAAYQAASPGDRVAVRSGTYGKQQISERANLPVGSAPVTFCVASGGSVTLDSGSVASGDLVIQTHDVVVSGAYCGESGQQTDHMTLATTGGGAFIGMSLGAGNRNVVLDNIHTGSVFTNAWATTIRYSEVGPLPNSVCQGGGQNDLVDLWWIGADETNPIQNVKVLYNYIHDGQCAPPSHVDAIQMEAGNTLIEGNRISNCSQLIFEGTSNPNGTSGVVIRNNMLEEQNSGTNGWTSSDCGSFQEVSSGVPYTFEYNTLDGQQTSTRGATVRGNIFLNQNGCAANSNCTNNVFPAGGRASGSNRACTPRLAGGAPWTNVDRHADYHLAANDTCARGAGGTDGLPPDDVDGVPRPLRQPDAGADEIP